MSTIALLDAYAYVHGHDFTTDTNQIQLTCTAAQLDRTHFRGGWTKLQGGLKTSQFAMAGFWQSAETDAVDPEAYRDLGVRDRPFTIGADEVEGRPAYLFRGGHFAYSLGGTVGEMAPFSLTSAGTDAVGVVRGALAAKAQDVAGIGPVGTGLQLGEVAAGQSLYAIVHVLAAPTTIRIDIESDLTSAFDTPEIRASFGPLTARGGTWLAPIEGPITDTWWRFTITDLTGAATVAAAIGIQ